MKNRFVVLRTTGTVWRFRGPSPFTELKASSSSDLSISTEELVPRDAALLRRDRTVKVIAQEMPVRLIEPRLETNEENYGVNTEDNVTWGVRAVGATNSPFTGNGIKVAVLDTGIEKDHTAFRNLEIVTQNFTAELDERDLNGHGTHCAATVAGRDINNLRVGVARGVNTLLVGKVLDAIGRGTTGTILKALYWAEAEGANLISMSLGFDFAEFLTTLESEGYPKPAAISRALEAYRSNLRLFDAISDWFAARELQGHGSLVIAAAGNESNREHPTPYTVFVTPPAASERHLSVAALGSSKSDPSGLVVAPFSNSGADVAAPGVSVASARLGGGVVCLSGTSMAAPHVCGIAALWGEKLLNETGRVRPSDLRALVVGNARFADGFDTDDVGRGIAYGPQIPDLRSNEWSRE